MARRSGFLQTMVQAQREAERKRIAQLRGIEKAQTQAARAAEKARKTMSARRLLIKKNEPDFI